MEIRKFTFTQISREFNFGKFRVSKMTILTIFIDQNCQKFKFRAYEIVKMAIFETFHKPKLFSQKIWVVVKFSNFHTVLQLVLTHFIRFSTRPNKLPGLDFTLFFLFLVFCAFAISQFHMMIWANLSFYFHGFYVMGFENAQSVEI